MGADSNTKPTASGSGSVTSSSASPGNINRQQADAINDPKKSEQDDSGKMPQVQKDNSNANNPPEINPSISRANSKDTNVNENVPVYNQDNDDEDPYSDAKDDLLTMNFNQDGGCLAVGTGSGFRICNVSPFQETFRRKLGGAEKAGIAHIEMLYRTNMLALTGHTTSPHYPPNKVLIYDDHLQKTVGELSFRQKVLATKLRRDRIIVVLRDRVYVYNFSDLDLLDKVHTGDNPRGLIGVSLDNTGVGGISSNSASSSGVERAEDALGSTSGGGGGQRNGLVLACPSTQRGQVRVELYGLRRTTFVDAHESALGALALSVDGSLLATASERGTVIRLFDTRGVAVGGGGRAARDSISSAGSGKDTTMVSSSVPLREFRRGVDRATISCLTFSLDSCWIGCASDHGTVHVFQATDPNNSNSNDSLSNVDANKSKSSSSMTGKAMRMLPKLVVAPKRYLMEGEQSYAQVRGIPHPQACAFVPDKENTIAVAGSDEYGNGCLLLAEFGTVKTGSSGIGQLEKNDDTEARRLKYHRFFKKGGAASMHKGGSRRHRSKSKNAPAESEIGAAYIDENAVETGLNDIQIGDENEDEFVPIDYNEKKSDS